MMGGHGVAYGISGEKQGERRQMRADVVAKASWTWLAGGRRQQISGSGMDRDE
jgi:hypothetical protein